jgi:hypothetical protein
VIKLTGLWWGKDKNGNDYLSGQMSRSARMLILKNTKKAKPSDPDMSLFVVEERPREEAPKEKEDDSF